MARTVKPNAERIKALRAAREWDVADLAEASEVSEATILNLEAGESCYRYTLTRVAKAFGYDTYLPLLDGPDTHKDEHLHAFMEVTIRIPLMLRELDQTKQLIQYIANLQARINGKSDFDLWGIDSGSVIIRLIMSSDDAIALLKAFQNEQLADFSIQDLQVRPIKKTTVLDRTASGSKNETIYYDKSGRLSLFSDASDTFNAGLGINTSYCYDAFGKREEVRSQGTPIPRSSETESQKSQNDLLAYSYDSNGNLRAVKDSSGITAYTYNDLNMLVSVTFPDGAVLTFQYSSLGCLVNASMIVQPLRSNVPVFSSI